MLGGAYDYFEALQNLDGYDVIETIAHQPWVLGNKVGMIGISYGAISQLFTAQTRPRASRRSRHSRRSTQRLRRCIRRHPQHRVRCRVGRTTPAKRRTRRSRPRAAVGKQPDRGRRSELRANQALHGEARS